MESQEEEDNNTAAVSRSDTVTPSRSIRELRRERISLSTGRITDRRISDVNTESSVAKIFSSEAKRELIYRRIQRGINKRRLQGINPRRVTFGEEEELEEEEEPNTNTRDTQENWPSTVDSAENEELTGNSDEVGLDEVEELEQEETVDWVLTQGSIFDDDDEPEDDAEALDAEEAIAETASDSDPVPSSDSDSSSSDDDSDSDESNSDASYLSVDSSSTMGGSSEKAPKFSGEQCDFEDWWNKFETYCEKRGCASCLEITRHPDLPDEGNQKREED